MQTPWTEAPNLGAAHADVTRLRLLVESTRSFEMTGGGTLTPTVEVGLRHDGGDADTGTGVEAGARFAYTSGALSIEGRVHTLVAHEESRFEEWGASGTVRIDPGASGRGLSFSLAPSWGAAATGNDRLWTLESASALSPEGRFDTEADNRLDSELAYGLGLRNGQGVVTPFAGMTLGDGRSVRTGARWQVARDAALALEAHRETSYDNDAETGIRLEARLRF